MTRLIGTGQGDRDCGNGKFAVLANDGFLDSSPTAKIAPLRLGLMTRVELSDRPNMRGSRWRSCPLDIHCARACGQRGGQRGLHSLPERVLGAIYLGVFNTGVNRRLQWPQARRDIRGF